MPESVRWKFYGYQTPAGGREVQEWFDGLDDDTRDALKDSLAYLEHLPAHQWVRPEWAPMGEGLSEVRVKTSDRQVRIYGCHWPSVRYSYTFLLGTIKKGNPQPDIAQARDRKARMERGNAHYHEFKY